MRFRPRMLLLALTVTLPSVTNATVRVDLSGPWQFRLDPEGSGERDGWAMAMPAGVETVRVPHTWGVGKDESYLGKAWYFRTLRIPDAVEVRRAEVSFGAVFYRARVFLDGRLAGQHEGGHTAFVIPLELRGTSEHLLTVEVDNRPDRATLPGFALRLAPYGNVWYDWWTYGGIVRKPELLLHGSGTVRHQEIRTRVGKDGARVTTRVVVASFGPGSARLEATVLAPRGEVVARVNAAITSDRATELAFDVPSPALWHFDHPNVYTLTLALLDAEGRVIDERSDTFGIRTTAIRNRGIELNGERVRLSGVTRHEESPWEGLAESEGTILQDWNDLKNLQVTLTRPVHYPQAPAVLDFADRNGILLVPEIPMWQFSEEQMKDPKVLALAKHMMTEMITEAGNHPSVIGWSVCNESATNTEGGRAYVQALAAHVRSLDPDRFVTYADDSVYRAGSAAENANQYTDVIMMNQYFGSWAGPAADLRPALEHVGRLFPDKPVIISEFGLAGPFAADAKAADLLRVDVLRSQLREFERHDFVAGAIFWCYQNYKSRRNLWPGEVEGEVDMGLVDLNRQRRPSYDVWREENAPARISIAFTRNETGSPSAFTASIERKRPDEIPSYELRGYEARWEAHDADRNLLASGKLALPVVGSPARLDGRWETTTSRSVTVRIRLLRPTGHVAAEKALTWWDARSGGTDLAETKRRGLDPYR